VSGDVKTVYVGAQVALDESGAVIGEGDIERQTAHVLHNLELALAGAGAGPDHIVRWNIFIVEGQSIKRAFAVFQRTWSAKSSAPANTVVFVSGFHRPELLIAIDAVAIVMPSLGA
jgi:enamine deaminase RidA (YjgF/YER057c/UK114 family)